MTTKTKRIKSAVKSKAKPKAAEPKAAKAAEAAKAANRAKQARRYNELDAIAAASGWGTWQQFGTRVKRREAVIPRNPAAGLADPLTVARAALDRILELSTIDPGDNYSAIADNARAALEAMAPGPAAEA